MFGISDISYSLRKISHVRQKSYWYYEMHSPRGIFGGFPPLLSDHRIRMFQVGAGEIAWSGRTAEKCIFEESSMSVDGLSDGGRDERERVRELSLRSMLELSKVVW